MTYINVHEEVWAELRRARAKWPNVKSRHEGYAVILEELDEYWEECRKRGPDTAAMRAELIQVAAMAIRVIEDVLDADS